jgi:hypothetical protein
MEITWTDVKRNLRQQTNVQTTTKPASGVFLLMFYYNHFISRLALMHLRKASIDDKQIRLFDVDSLYSLPLTEATEWLKDWKEQVAGTKPIATGC